MECNSDVVRARMSEQITIQIPVCFPGTPVKHRSPKLIYGSIPLCIEIPTAPDSEVNEGFEVEYNGNSTCFVEYDGQYYRSLQAVNFPDIGDVIASNIQPVENSTIWIKADERKAKARKTGLKLFPDTGNEPEYRLPAIDTQCLTESDMESLEPIFSEARTRLSTLRVINREVCRPIPEPIFLVCLSVGTHGDASEIRVEMTSVDTEPLYLGCPVAYFRADQQNEANAYAAELGSNLGTTEVKPNSRVIRVQNPHLLNADPYLMCLLEIGDWAARQLKDGNEVSVCVEHNLTSTEVATAIRDIIGENDRAWRKAPTLPLTEAQRAELERLVRISVQFDSVSIPKVVFETALERWEERPVDFEVGTPTKIPNSTSVAMTR
jgi:hypothetical protein